MNQNNEPQQSEQIHPMRTPLEELSYEQSRDALVQLVQRMETGGATLDETIAMWERGEQLADRCQEFLDGAEARLTKALEEESQQ